MDMLLGSGRAPFRFTLYVCFAFALKFVRELSICIYRELCFCLRKQTYTACPDSYLGPDSYVGPDSYHPDSSGAIW